MDEQGSEGHDEHINELWANLFDNNRHLEVNVVEEIVQRRFVPTVDTTDIFICINSFLPSFSKFEVIINEWDVDDLNGCAEYFLNNIIYSDHWEKHIGYAGLSYGTRVRFAFIAPSQNEHEWVRKYLDMSGMYEIYSEYRFHYL